MRLPSSGMRAVLIAAAVAACGEAKSPAPGAVPSAPRTPTRAAARAERPDAAAPAPSAAEIEALVAEWDAAEWGPARRALRDRVVAGGARVLEFLVARFVREPRGADFDLLVAFGAPAIAPLLDRIGGASPEARVQIVALLDVMALVWRETEQGAAVCRALLPLLLDEDVRSEAVRALASSRPAGRVVARELGDLWLSGDETARSLAAQVLRELGPDAAPAAPALVAALAYVPPAPTGDEDSDPTESDEEQAKIERCEGAAAILREIGACDPTVLAELRKRLAPGTFGRVQTLAASVLRTWGDAAAAASLDLLRLLGEPASDVRDAAMAALCAMPSRQEQVWEAVSAAIVRGDAWTRDVSGMALPMVAGHRVFGPRLGTLAATLPPDAAFALADAVGYHDSHADWTGVAAKLIASPDPEARQFAMYVWDEHAKEGALPDRATDWLDDSDPSVRAYAAAILAGRGGAPPDRIRDVALAALRSENPGDRRDAVRALGALSAHDARALETLVAVLGSDPHEGVREGAADALGTSDAAIPGDHADAVAWLAARIERRIAGREFQEARESFVRAILRFAGGDAALSAAVVRGLGAATAQRSLDLEFVAVAAGRAGPRLAAARPALARLRASLDRDPFDARYVDSALAAIDADPVAIARDTARPAAETVHRLLSMGDAGRRAVVLLAGHVSMETEAWRAALGDTDLSAEIAAAAATPAPDALHAQWLAGAATLAPLLADVRAVELCTRLASSDDPGVRRALVASLREVERRAPGTVPAALVRRLLESASDDPAAAFALAGDLGPRAADLVPRLRQVRDSGEAPAVDAAIALWRITRDADESLPTLRSAVSSGALWDGGIDIASVADALAQMPLGKADLDALLAAVRSGQLVGIVELAALLERFGPEAAPAVPSLRRMLAWRGEDDEEAGPGAEAGVVAARVLAAIGAAARPAIPDLRKWAVDTRDPNGVAREAIRKIEAAQ